MRDNRRVTTENFRRRGIDDFVNDFYYVFRDVDSRRSLRDIWMHTVEHASRLAEEIRRERYDRVQEELAGVAAWVMSFVANSGTKQDPPEKMLRFVNGLSDIVWNKYPGCCPVCEKKE